MTLQQWAKRYDIKINDGPGETKSLCYKEVFDRITRGLNMCLNEEMHTLSDYAVKRIDNESIFLVKRS